MARMGSSVVLRKNLQPKSGAYCSRYPKLVVAPRNGRVPCGAIVTGNSRQWPGSKPNGEHPGGPKPRFQGPSVEPTAKVQSGTRPDQIPRPEMSSPHGVVVARETWGPNCLSFAPSLARAAAGRPEPRTAECPSGNCRLEPRNPSPPVPGAIHDEEYRTTADKTRQDRRAKRAKIPTSSYPRGKPLSSVESIKLDRNSRRGKQDPK